MKNWFANLSLGRKLSLINLATTVAASFFAALVLVSHLWSAQRQDLMKDAAIIAQLVAHVSAPALRSGDAAAATVALGALARNDDVAGAELFLADGRRLAAYRRPDVADEAWALADFADAGPAEKVTSHFHLPFLDAIAPVESDGRRVGTLLLRLELSAAYERVGKFIGVILITAIGAILLASWLLNRLLHNILGPIKQLVLAMADVSANGDYSQRAEAGAHDEIGDLAHSFNFMIEQIQRRDAALGRELAERKRAEVQLEQLAHYDSVTGLPNRHYFNRRTVELGRLRGKRDCCYALMFIDLDNFKYVNDNFGHPVGDALLGSVSERLQQTLRVNDLVVRLGGDEFAVLLDSPKSVDDATRLAGKMLTVLAEPFTCDGHEFNVGASIGVAMMPDHAREFDELLSCADAAMYAAKSLGKNNVQVWKPEMSARTAQRFTIEAGLRKAIDNHELEVYYQPIIELASGRLAGMEALLRWRHPILGFIAPAEFIPIAEESRLIVGVGEWVLRQACAQVCRWLPRFGPLFVAVNVSARQFREPGFADSTEQIVRETGCPSTLLELEVTETVIMEQTAETLAILVDLADRGFRLSLDDFGTGYSSLAYLKRFPLNKLKIDCSFVTDLPHNLDDATIAQAIIALAQNLGMGVVAEGVETSEQADFLRQLDCTYGQGFLFGRPLPVERFEIFAEENLGPRLRLVSGN